MDTMLVAIILALVAIIVALLAYRQRIVRDAQETLQSQFDTLQSQQATIQSQQATISQQERDLNVANAEILEMTYILDEERIKSDEVLISVLPSSVVYRLKAGESPIADTYTQAGLLIVDIDGFSKITQGHSAEESVAMLNWLFSMFDEVVEQYGVEKLKTVGDTYIITSGIPDTRTYSPRTLALCALDLLKTAEKFKEIADTSVGLRMGLDFGPVMAGLIGKHKFSYDIWGETVKTAHSLQAHCKSNSIHCSHHAWQLLNADFSLDAAPKSSVGDLSFYLLAKG
jgi:adenylate cyclase